MILSITTLSITQCKITLRIRTLGITTLSITQCITTLRIMTLGIIIIISLT
jgi:hypothetical protein